MDKKALIIAIAAVVVVFGVIVAIIKNFSGGAQQHKMPPPPVIVDSVKSASIAASESFIGKVDAVGKAAITARVNGYLEKILVKEGDFVEKDTILFTIEKSQYSAAVRQAQAALTQAQANARNTDLTLQRSKALLDSDGISRARYDDAVAADGVAKANVSAAAAAMEAAKLNLEYADVRTPISGKVGLITYNIGETVGPNSGTITTVIAPGQMYVIFSISSKQIQEFRRHYNNVTLSELMENLELTLALSDGTQYKHIGKINFVDNAVVGATDTIRIRGEFENPEGALTQGQTVTVGLRSKKTTSQLIIPQTAIINDIGGKYVLFVGQNNIVERRSVTAGSVSGANQIILDGLTEGDQIVVDGIQKVVIGGAVTPMTVEQFNAMIREQAAKAGSGAKK